MLQFPSLMVQLKMSVVTPFYHKREKTLSERLSGVKTCEECIKSVMINKIASH